MTGVQDVPNHYNKSQSPYGFTVAGFEANTRIDRRDWDVTWNVPLDTGGVLAGYHIDINIQLELMMQEEKEEESV